MTPNRDEQMARLSLTLDPKERANLMAEHERWERRRRAMKRGDEGSIVPGLSDCECGPLTFAPIQCSSCGVKLTSQNHNAHRMCQRCAEESEALWNFEQARLRLIAENNAALAKPSLLRRFLSLFSRGRGRK